MTTIIVFAIVHTAGLIWWMSKITTTLDTVVKSLEQGQKVLAMHEATYARKEDVSREIGALDKKADKAHERIDSLIGKA